MTGRCIVRLVGWLCVWALLVTPAIAQTPEPAPGDDSAVVTEADLIDLSPMSPEEREATIKSLTVRIETMRERVIFGQLVKLEAKSEARFDLMAEVLGWFSLSGLLLLLMPLWLRRRYPGQMKKLIAYSALASATFVVVMLIFSTLILTFKTIQTALASITNPVLQLTNGAFDALIHNLGSLVEAAPLLLETPLAQLESGAADGVSMALMQNAGSLVDDAQTFANLAGALSWVKDILGVLPIIMAVVVVVLFLMSLKDVIRALVTLPQQALDGHATAGQTMRKVGGRLRAEIVVSLLLLIAFAVVTILSAIAMTSTAEPVADALVGYTMLNSLYLVFEPGASTLLVYASVGSALMFVMLALVSILVASVLFLGKFQKVLQARFIDQVPLKTHARFFKLGSLALLWALVLPLLFIIGAELVSEVLLDVDLSGEVSWGLLLASAPLLLVVGFLLAYWLLRGLRAQRFLFKYPVKPAPAEAVPGA